MSNLSIYYIWKFIKMSYKNNKFKIPAPTWNEEFELTDGSYSVSGIQEYYKYIFKNLETVADNPSSRLLTAKSRSARGASRQPASMGSFLTICQMCLPCPHLVDGCDCSLGLGSENKETVKIVTQPYLIAWWLWRRTPAAKALVRHPQKIEIYSLLL